MPVVDKPGYVPPRLLRQNLLMYLWSNYVRRVPKPKYKMFEPIRNPAGNDASYFELAWLYAKPGKVGTKVALVAPGLSGGEYSKPTRGMVRALHENDWDVAVWVYRDTGTSKRSSSPTSVRNTYSGYGVGDLCIAVNYLALKKQYKEISLVGLSLGGNVVIQYVCTHDGRRVSKAVAISPPIAFGETVEYWSQAILGRLLISPAAKRGMKGKVKKKWNKVRNDSEPAVSKSDYKAYRKVRTAAEADHYINSEFNGYTGTSQYWRAANTLTALRNIKTQTALLIVLAKDDPYLESHSYPHSDIVSSDVTVELTKNGSHVGFAPRGWNRHLYWSEQRAIDHVGS